MRSGLCIQGKDGGVSFRHDSIHQRVLIGGGICFDAAETL